MIHLLNSNKKKIAGLKNYKDLYIESLLESGDKTLSFLYHKNEKYYSDILTESYILTKTDEFIVKEINSSGEYTQFICKLNVEDLEGKEWDRFISEEQSITDALNLALAGTGWSVKENTIKKKRTVRKSRCSSWDIIQEIKKTYRFDISFDTVNKKVEVYKHLGSYKGTYFIENLNLKSIDIQENTNDYYTRIIPIGKDGLNIELINEGKKYLENYQYTNKVKTFYWIDERYTVKESLKEDAIAKLNEISKPYRSYGVETINLAKMNKKYKDILDYSLGDEIYLISKKNRIKEKQRIVKTIEYPNEHHRDRCELSNTVLKFEDIQRQFQETSDTVDNITTDNGTVDGKSIDSIEVKQIEDFKANVIKVTNLNAINADILKLKTIKADIQDLNAVTARIGILESTAIKTKDLEVVNAKINTLEVSKADISLLNAQGAKINILEARTASIDNLLAGNLTANNFQAGAITAGSGIIAEGAIGDAEISSLSGNKLRFGTIDTSLVNILGPNGRLKIQGNKIQIFDSKGNSLYERIMLGVDEENNSSLVLRGSDGVTVLLNQNGLTKEGITEGFSKADDGTLNAMKLDKNSIVRQVNGATETIKGTKVTVGDRTLDVELSTQKNTITEHGKELSTQKTTMEALDKAIKLKVDNQTFKETKDSINANVSDKINNLKYNIEAYVDIVAISKSNDALVKAENKIKDSLNDAKTYTNVQINTVNTNLSKATAELNILKEQISTKVSQSDIDRTVNNIEIGGRNLIIDSKELNNFSNRIKDKVNGFSVLIGDIKLITSTYIDVAYWNNTITPTPNTKYTLSFYAKGVGRFISYFYPNCVKSGYSNLGATTSAQDGAIYHTLTNSWRKYIITWKTLNSVSGIKNVIAGRLQKGNNSIQMYGFKFEKGNKVTDWTPAPEDTDQLIADNIKIVTDKINTVESTFKQAKDSLQASVNSLNSTTQTITTNLTNTTNNLTNRINVAKNEAIVDARTIPDTRSTNESPQWYLQNYRRQTITEFKYAKAIQIPNTINNNHYGTLETKVPWGDSSGGYPTQIFRSNSFPTYQRHGTSNNEWSKWEQIEDTNGSQEKANSALNNAKTYTNAQITTVNTRVSNTESSLNILREQISTKVSKSDIDKISTSIDNKITKVTEKINTVESTFTQKTNNINLAVSSVQKTLSTKADGSTVESLKSQLASFNIGLDGIKLEVAKKTDKDNIISSINQSAEEIKIDASRIKLNGITTFSKETGYRAIEVNGTRMSFYDWGGSERTESIGAVFSTRMDGDVNRPGICIGNEIDSMVYIAYYNESEKVYHPYISFDKYKINKSVCPITINEDINLDDNIFYLTSKKRNSLFENSNGDFLVKTAHGFKVADKDNSNIYIDLDANKVRFAKWDQKYWYAEFFPDGFTFASGKGTAYFWAEAGSPDIWTGKGVNMRIQGSLSVNGKKNRIVETSIGDLALNAVESTECWFTDIEIEQNRTDAKGDCTIWFSNKFLLTVNTKYRYKIDLTPIGEFARNGKLTYVRVVEKTEKYFKVRGTPNTLFDWTITAKQIGYENIRLEKVEKAS